MSRFMLCCLASCALPWLGAASEECVADGNDTQMLVGTLNNGLKYYIRNNHSPEQRAYLALAVRVGSLYENEDEKGIAHFIEHLNFRGSENFAEGEAVSYLESVGAWFGADTNAFTSLDVTMYKLDVPIAEDGTVDQALLILRDFGGRALLTDGAIEKERKIVLDELHQNLSSAEMRLLKRSLDAFLPETSLSSFLPIGTEEIISTVSPETLRSFYHRWYRPDRMAVIAVGDFDAQMIQEKVKVLFDDEAEDDSLEEFPIVLDAPKINEEELHILRHFDPELSLSRVVLHTFFPDHAHSMVPEEALKEQILTEMVNCCFEKRLLQFQEDGLALFSFVMESPFLYHKLKVSMRGSILLKETCIEGMRLFQRHLQTIAQHGFTMEDWNAAKEQLLEKGHEMRQTLDRITHEEIAQHCMAHFLCQKEPLLLAPAWTADHWNEIVNSISLEECNAFLAKMHHHEKGHILFATSDPELYEMVSDDLLADIFFADQETEPLAVREAGSFSFVEPEKKGEIVLAQAGPIHDWSLSNEMRLLCKPSELEKGQVQIRLQSDRGLMQLAEEDWASGNLISQYMDASGLNGLNRAAFFSYLQSRGIQINTTISMGATEIAFSTPKEHLKTVFQVIHELYRPFRFDPSRWPIVLAQHQEIQRQMLNNPDVLFSLYVQKQNTQNHYFFRPLELSLAQRERAEALTSYFLGDPKRFTAIVVGDVEVEEVKELAIQYLASIPGQKAEENFSVTIPTLFPSETKKEEFACGNNSYERTVIIFPVERGKGEWNSQAVRKWMEQRLLEALRWQEASTYRVYVSINRPFFPSWDEASLYIAFTCQKEDRDLLVQKVFKEIENWKTTLCSEQEVVTLRQLLLKARKQAEESNSFWMNEISHLVKTGQSLEMLDCYQAEIEKITPESLQEAVMSLFASPYYSIFTHVPKKLS